MLQPSLWTTTTSTQSGCLVSTLWTLSLQQLLTRTPTDAEIYLEKIYDLLEAPTPVVSVSTSSTTSTSSSIFQSGFGFFGAGAKAKQMVKNLQTVKRNALSLKHDKTSGNKYVHGMKEVRVHSAEVRHRFCISSLVPSLTRSLIATQEARTILARGQANRSVFGTGANSESSRSHSVFTIKIVKIRKGANPEDPNAATTSRFSIVDLAGSERANNTGAVGESSSEWVLEDSRLTITAGLSRRSPQGSGSDQQVAHGPRSVHGSAPTQPREGQGKEGALLPLTLCDILVD